MQPINDWDDITATNGGGGTLPEGGYVCKIEAVSDHTNDATPYLGVVFNPYVDGKFYYGADAADWQHEVRVFTSGGLGRWKMLVECVKNSEGNAGFAYNAKVPNHEQQVVGKWVGMVINHRLYTKGPRSKNPGKDGVSLQLQHVCTTQAISAGDYPAPVTKDDRDKSAAPVSSGELADYDLPF